MNQVGLIAAGGLLSIISGATHADTFLNDSALLEQVPEHGTVV